MVFIDLMIDVEAIVSEDKFYHLSPGVRVRRETFGLLFYNSRDTRLTFIRSGDLLDIAFISRRSRGIVICGHLKKREAKVQRVLEILLTKGLIVDA